MNVGQYPTFKRRTKDSVSDKKSDHSRPRYFLILGLKERCLRGVQTPLPKEQTGPLLSANFKVMPNFEINLANFLTSLRSLTLKFTLGMVESRSLSCPVRVIVLSSNSIEKILPFRDTLAFPLRIGYLRLFPVMNRSSSDCYLATDYDRDCT